MAWLISKALAQAFENSHFLREQAEAFSEENSLDGKPSALSNGANTPQAYCAPDKMKGFSRLSQFGMTFKILTDDHGAELLTWYLADSRAKTSVLPERARASTESALGCGATWQGSLARFDRDSLSWKTAQRSLLGDSEPSSVIWPRSGMTADGQCWELPTLGRTTSGTGSGLWQTPVADDAVNRVKGKINSRGEPKLSAQVIRWPTPLASEWKNGCGKTGNRAPEKAAKAGLKLAEAVRNWPTPATRDYRSPNKLSHEERGGGKKGEQLPNAVGGQLNPTWTEWLMGWPLGWTVLRPSETDKCHFAPQPHGECSAINEIKEAA